MQISKTIKMSYRLSMVVVKNNFENDNTEIYC